MIQEAHGVMVIYRHSFSHCDCVLVGDPCLVVQHEGISGTILDKTNNFGGYEVLLNNGMTLWGIGIEEMELVK